MGHAHAGMGKVSVGGGGVIHVFTANPLVGHMTGWSGTARGEKCPGSPSGQEDAPYVSGPRLSARARFPVREPDMLQNFPKG